MKTLMNGVPRLLSTGEPPTKQVLFTFGMCEYPMNFITPGCLDQAPANLHYFPAVSGEFALFLGGFRGICKSLILLE